MWVFDEYKEKIKKLTKKNTYSKTTETFFENAFFKFDLKSQNQILEIFDKVITGGSVGNSWNHYLSQHLKIAKIILDETAKRYEQFFKETDNQQCLELLKSIKSNMIIDKYVSKNKLDINIVNQVIEKIYDMSKIDSNIVCDKTVQDILKHIIVNIACSYSKSQSNMNQNLFNKLELLLHKYIERVDLYNDTSDLYNRIIETASIIDMKNLLEEIALQLEKKDNSKDNRKVAYKELIYCRAKKSLLPKELCIKLFQNKNLDDKIIQIASIDYLRNILFEHNIKDVAIVIDNNILIKGSAGTNSIRLFEGKLNITSFHELVHIFQNHDMFFEKKYIGNRYSMLKDYLIASRVVDYSTYRNNYPSFLFEEEAEQEGCKMYYQFLKDSKIGDIPLDELDKLIFAKLKPIKVLNTINISGKMVNKNKLFDNFLLERPETISEYPILQIEYNLDGSRKTNSEILFQSDGCHNTGISEEELLAVKKCILQESKFRDDDGMLFMESKNVRK